jgi:hypothetical protein
MHYPHDKEKNIGEADYYDERFRVFHEIAPGSYHCISIYAIQQGLTVSPWNRLSGEAAINHIICISRLSINATEKQVVKSFNLDYLPEGNFRLKISAPQGGPYYSINFFT